ncbi:restriction endonuclease subunit S [Lactococcus petauri]|uniref:restriction endonuclease subunit S n=1 Tax=Lactococcus petauri TaxID=1940789 RepID=UPI003851FE2A
MSKKVPQIRFNGYSDTWTENQLSSLIKIARQQEIKKEQLSSKPEGYYVLAMRTFSKDGYIDFSKPYWIKSDIEDKNAFLLPGEFAIIDADMDTSLPKIGKVLLNSYNKKFLLAAHVRKINVQSNVNSYFMYGVMRNEQLLRRLKKESSGSIAQGLLDKNIYKQTVYIPKILEQEKIGLFFKEFENIIALHQHKLDLLKEQKKGYLQKMFPKNGEKVPELRFAGFADDWEERKLGDLATSFEYGLNASAKSFDGTHKYIRITDIDDSSRKFNSQSLTSPDIDLSSADNHKLKNGDILFARTGASVGKSYIYADSDGLVYYAGFLIRARIKSGVDSNFVFQHTLTSSYENFIRVTSQRSGQPGVNAKEYSTFEISVPSYEEQRKIGSFFKQLDDTIALHQRKLDLLKEQKKGFLQKMFV